MDKIIKYQIEVSPKQRKGSHTKYEFYSHDRNNTLFEFELPEVMEELSATALFYFNSSHEKWETVATVEENRITVKFDTTLITRNENVTGYLYFKQAEKKADVFKFQFAVRVSKIDDVEIADKVKREDKPNAIEMDLSKYATKVDLEQLKHDLTSGVASYDDAPILKRLAELERREVMPFDDSRIQERLRVLEERADKDTVYNDSELRERVELLERKEDKDTIYDDSRVLERLAALERKPDKDTVYDDTAVKERLSKLETKPAYNDVPLLKRLEELERKPDKDTVYNDRELRGRVQALEDAPVVDISMFATKAEMAQFVTREEIKPAVISRQLDSINERLESVKPAKLGANLLANSGNKVTNKQYPTTYLTFAQQPTVGKKYTMTVKVDAPASKTGVVVAVRNNISLGTLNKVKDGIYSLTFDWKPNPSNNPYELVLYQPPNNGVEASLVWAKFVEGVDTDYNWYPNYTEISNVYTFAEEASAAIESSGNLLDNTLAERKGTSEFMSYADIASVIDTYGVGKYTLSFDLKAATAGNMGVYMSGTAKYTFLQEIVAVGTEYKRYTLHLDMTTNVASASSAMLSFFGGKYGNGVVPSVRKVRLSKGIYNEMAWKPSERELTDVYERLLNG